MPAPKNDNPKFLALRVFNKNVLAETPCAVCDELAPVKRRNDGWAEIRCNGDTCGYTEIMDKADSFEIILGKVLGDERTVFPRSSKDEILTALDISPPPIEDKGGATPTNGPDLPPKAVVTDDTPELTPEPIAPDDTPELTQEPIAPEDAPELAPEPLGDDVDEDFQAMFGS